MLRFSCAPLKSSYFVSSIVNLLMWATVSGEPDYTIAVYKGREYLLSDMDARNFNAARNACQRLNGDLAVVNSQDLHNWLENNLLNGLDRTCGNTDKTVPQVWIGLRILSSPCGRPCRNNWTWVNDTSAADWQNWYSGDPQGGEDCVRLYVCWPPNTVYYWAGAQCSREFLWHMCERDLNECLSDPCNNNSSCTNTPGSFTCECQDGWKGDTCQEDIDECQLNPCSENSINCTNTQGSFTCLCQKGWLGETCTEDVDECESDPCINNSTCINTPGSFTCQCQKAWEGDMCQEDIDECLTDPCNNSTCINIPGSFVCHCRDGWTGITCHEDVDECNVSDVCSMNGNCTNLPGAYSCNCSHGWFGDNCEVNGETSARTINEDEKTIIAALRATVAVAGVIALLLILTIVIVCILNKRLEKKSGQNSSSEKQHHKQTDDAVPSEIQHEYENYSAIHKNCTT